MSQFYDLASLVVIPSGYKASTIYAQKPLTTDGQLSFTRASGATRVGPNGLIEEVRTNLVLQSNTFSNASWTKSSVTVTGGQAGYDGTNNAWLLSKSAVQYVGVLQNVANSGLVTCSFYAKAGTNSKAGILCVSSPSNLYVGFDLTNGSITGIQNGVVSTSAQSVGNGWYRLSATFNGTISQFAIYPDSIDGASAGNILIQNAQVEAGDIATDYIPTTTAAVSVGPVSNVPRLDYTNSSCPRLLLEPQRTNLVFPSESFSSWSEVTCAVASNTAIAPDGYQGADTLTFTASASSQRFSNQSSATVGTHTFSVYAKSSTAKKFRIKLAVNTGSGVVDNFSANFTTTSSWQRFSFTQTVAGSIVHFAIANESGAVAGSADFWGAMGELGSYTTSYIPSLNSTVTRVADAASKTGISSLIGQSAGTIFWDITDLTGTATGSGNPDFGIRNAAFTNWIGITTNTFASPFRVTVRPTTGSIIDYTANLTRVKAAVAWSTAGAVLYVNGAQVAISAVNPNFSFDRINMLGDIISYKTNQALLFKTRLTNAQLAELTTL